MQTFEGVFKRKEVKYRLDARQAAAMRKAIDARMAPDEYGRTTITSVYYDTPSRDLISRSLEKPLYKEKLRVRSYGCGRADAADRVFVEIKKKFKGIVYKRRVGLSQRAARAYLAGAAFERACAAYPLADPLQAQESLCARSRQIASEVDAFRAAHAPLAPSAAIRCERTAFTARPEAPDAQGVRLTVDENIRYVDLMGACAAQPAPLVPLLKRGEAIMEIKVTGPFPLWLAHALDACGAYPTSFSKYGEAYKACCAKACGEGAPHLAEGAAAAACGRASKAACGAGSRGDALAPAAPCMRPRAACADAGRFAPTRAAS